MRTAVALVLSIGLSIARPPALRAETHRFVAKGSATAYSAALEPALRLKSGDRVVTTTPNEAGRLIGPFVIDGAEAGDLLVVTLDALRPEGDVGYSTSTVVAGAIAPGGLTGRPDSKRFPWTIDAAARVVRFDLAAAPYVLTSRAGCCQEYPFGRFRNTDTDDATQVINRLRGRGTRSRAGRFAQRNPGGLSLAGKG